MQTITILSQTHLLLILIFSSIVSIIHGYAGCKKNTFRALLIRSSYAYDDVSPVILNLNQPFNIH